MFQLKMKAKLVIAIKNSIAIQVHRKASNEINASKQIQRYHRKLRHFSFDLDLDYKNDADDCHIVEKSSINFSQRRTSSLINVPAHRPQINMPSGCITRIVTHFSSIFLRFHATNEEARRRTLCRFGNQPGNVTLEEIYCVSSRPEIQIVDGVDAGKSHHR